MFLSFLDRLSNNDNRCLIESIKYGYQLIYNHDNILVEGIHFGDKGIGSDTYLGRMHAGNGNRGTGHFGTGTYFLSDSNDNTHLRNTRPTNTIDQRKYKLLKITNKHDADALHSGLKILNSVVDAYIQGDDNQIALLDKAIALISKVVRKANYFSSNQLLQLAQEKANIFNNEGISSTNTTLSTDFIKMLGYNGIDVTEVPEYDNSMFGSVIYNI